MATPEVREECLAAILDTQPAVQHIERFNTLLYEWIPNMIMEHGGIDTVYEENGVRHRYVVSVTNYRFARQHVTPDEAHVRNLNYAVDLIVNLKMDVYRLPQVNIPQPPLPPVEQHPTEHVGKKRREPVDVPGKKRKDPLAATETSATAAAAAPKKRGRKRKTVPVEPAAGVFSTVEQEVALKKREEEQKVLVYTESVPDHILCSFPNMLHSAGCILSDGCGQHTRIQNEMGGSLIMRGKRRFIPFMERLHYNDVFLFTYKGNKVCEVRSEHLDRKHRSTSTIHILLTSPKRGKRVGQTQQIFLVLPFLKPHVPLHIMGLALGYRFADLENAMYQMDTDPATLRVDAETYMHRMRHSHYNCHTRDEALMFIADLYKRKDADSEKTKQSIIRTLNSEVFPHLNHTYHDVETTNLFKLRYLGWLCAMLFRFGNGTLPETDRDSYEHVVVDGSAELLAQLFRQNIISSTKQAVKTMRRALNVRPKPQKKGALPKAAEESKPQFMRVNLKKMYNAARLTPKFMSPVSTGRWSEEKKGVSHAMKTTNSIVILSQLRRVSSSMLGNQGKHIDPRMTHVTSYGLMCAAETPDGEACGLVYTLAMTAIVSAESDTEALVVLILEFLIVDLYVPLHTVPLTQAIPATWWKFIGPNGILYGWVTDVREATRRLRASRRCREIDPSVAIYTNENTHCLIVKASSGRVQRPLFVLENIKKLPDLVRVHRNKPASLFTALMDGGVIEYMDAAEAFCDPHQVAIAFAPKDVRPFHTHLEISDVAFVGLTASYIPYFRHNQGPRLVYQIGMAKQYISPEAADDYGASTSHILHYGQHPLVSTIREDPGACDGVNVILALIPHPRCMEDALVFKRQAIQRGMFHSSSIRTHTATHTPRNVNQPQDKFEKPDPERTFGMKNGDYTKLQADGLPLPGTFMNTNDVVIGKTIGNTHVAVSARVKVPHEFRDPQYGEYRRDASIQVRKGEKGVVHEVIVAPNMRTVRVRMDRPAIKGDKFSNRHGQKGTVGFLEDEWDMPFNPVTGMIPDVIIGPTSLPSRMTMGMVIEMLVGKAVAASACLKLGLDQQICDAAITEQNITKVQEVLVSLGYQSSGRERLCDGRTGKMLECAIMMGPCMYGKMDHMVIKKVHARARGPVQPLTRQPMEGRRNDGGFRLGNMEIDVLTSYGAASILRERSTQVSDEIKMYRCGKCGFAGDANPDIGLFMCRVCNTSEHMLMVKQSYSSNLMMTELACDGVSTRYILRKLDPVFE